jgi:cell division protein FtsW
MSRFRDKARLDESLLVAYLLVSLAGIIMVYSTSSIIAESRFGSQWYFLRQQILWAVISLVTMVAILRLNLQRLAVWSVPMLAILYVALALVFAMPARNGAHRWLMLGPLTMQPSEMFKFVMIMFMAMSLSNPKRNVGDLRQLLIHYGPMIGLGLALILAQPDLGMTIVIGLTATGMFFLAGVRWKHLFYSVVPLAAVGSLVVFILGYKRQRIMDYIAAVVDPLHGSYQVKQAALTLGSGGLWGTGLGEGQQKLFFLPYPHTDFILAATGEELGFVGLVVILVLLFVIMWRGCRIAAAQPDRFGFLLAGGMTIGLFVNIAINIGVVTAILPVTGRPLPFLSYGGSSLLMSSCAVAVLLNLSRRTRREPVG